MRTEQTLVQNVSDLERVRREKMARLKRHGRDPFVITRYDQTHYSTGIIEDFENLEGSSVSVAGRIMLSRIMGRASFCTLRDMKGQIQIYVTRDDLGDEAYSEFRTWDCGDIVGARGKVFRTRTGEVTVHVSTLPLLVKFLTPLPNKFQGLRDPDRCYLQSYVDLITNERSRHTLLTRSEIIHQIRTYLYSLDFVEVETPVLVANAGGASARPFETHINSLGEDVNLRISLELYLKRLIIGGTDRVFEIGKVFRNEGVDTRHNPEFTLMELTEDLFRFLAEKNCGSTVITYAGTRIDFGKPFRRLTMIEAIRECTGIDFDTVPDDTRAKALAEENGIPCGPLDSRGTIIASFFDAFCEEKMIQPTFIMDHPIEISPLTKKKPGAPDRVERFELYINGWEMANAYSELNDPIDQRERFAAQDALALAGDDETQHTDEDFLHAMEIGIPPAGGIGCGIDRLVMLLTDSPAILDVLLFPTMRRLS